MENFWEAPELKDTVASLRDRYDKWALSYDEQTHQFQWIAPQFLLEALVKYAPPSPSMRVLDIGVGTGQSSVPYLKAGAEVTGLDLSADMLHQARLNYPQFHALIERDFNRPLAEAGLGEDKFDLILSCGAIHFAIDLAHTLAELRSLLSPGGVLGFTYIPPQERAFSSAAKVQEPSAVEQMLQDLDLVILDREPFVAYYEGGDRNDPVSYQRVVTKCLEAT